MQDKRYHIIIASTLFAVLMWVSVNMGYEYTVTRHIPVVIENLKDGKALKFPVPKYVSVRFKGHGWLMAGLYFLTNVTYFIDVSSLNNEQFIITARDLPDHVKLPLSVQPVDVKPDTILLALDDYIEKRVPIIPHVLLDYHEGYGQVGSVKVVPDSVIIGGGKDMVTRVTQWETAFQKFDNLRTSIDAVVSLEEPTNYSLEIFHTSTRLIVNVQPYAEKTFTGIALRVVGMPATKEIIFVPPKLDVTVRGGIDQLAKLSNADFQTMTDYQQLLLDTSGIVIPTLIAPQGVKVINHRPERFQFYIRKRL
jgi:YbbR domain-containing protein